MYVTKYFKSGRAGGRARDAGEGRGGEGRGVIRVTQLK